MARVSSRDKKSAKSYTYDVQDQLEDAIKIGGVGTWVWDMEHDTIVANPSFAKLFGVRPALAAKGMPLEAFTGNVHANDLRRVMRAIKTATMKGQTFEEEYRVVNERGQTRWVLARGKVEKRNGRLMFPGVVVDITERRELQAQIELAHQQDLLNRQAAKILQERNDELETISRTKDEFVALASHQLRTPATAVKQYLGMVLQGYVGEITELQASMLAKAFESNERQIQIINQILNAARVDTGRLAMSPVRVDLVQLTRGITDEMRSSIELRRHSLDVQLPKQPLWIMADLGYLRMAIENLLNNASIYTYEGGEIKVRAQRRGKQARLSVTDNGVGIKKIDQKKLFAKFSRIHNPLSVQAGGSGIGLYLTAEIVRLHTGTIDVESKIGKGTMFAISLPLTQNSS